MTMEAGTSDWTGCTQCCWYRSLGRCEAYPDGIPAAFAFGAAVHDAPLPGTGGFVFRRRSPYDPAQRALAMGLGPHLADFFGRLADLSLRLAPGDPLPPVGTFGLGDPSERLVAGYLLANAMPDGTLVADREGDEVTFAELERAHRRFMQGERRADADHRIRGVGQVLEAVVLTKEKRQALGLPAWLWLGWVGVVRVDDDAVWQSVVTGQRPAFSVGGEAIRTALTSG